MPAASSSKRATLLGLRVDDAPYLSLSHQGRGMGPGGEVGEQALDVAGAGVGAVDAVIRPRLPLDAPRDLDLVVVVVRRGRGAVGVVQLQDDFRDVGRAGRWRR